MNLHGARGAELLTAEATDAGLAVNDRLSALHGDGLGGADLGTLATAYALALLQLRTGGEKYPQYLAHQLALGGEQVTVAYRYVLKILDGKVLGGLPSIGMLHRDQIHRFRAQTFLVGDPITPGPSFS